MRRKLSDLAGRFRAAINDEPLPEAIEPEPEEIEDEPEEELEDEPEEEIEDEPEEIADDEEQVTESTQVGMVKFVIDPRCRVDILAYSGVHCGGQLSLIRVFPNGKHKGKLKISELQSVMLAGTYGVRVTFATSTSETEWETKPWRCVRLEKGNSFVARNGRPAVRIPDLEYLDGHKVRRANTEFRTSFQVAEHRDDPDTAWSFGRPGRIKNQVRVIYVDKVEL